MKTFSKDTNRTPIAWIVLLTGIWLILWFAPWQPLLAFSVWLQLGAALLIFIAPGFCLYGLAQTESADWVNHITFGFVISHLLLAILGILGRFIHISFDALKHGVMALSLILTLLYATPRLHSIRFPRFEISTKGKILSYWTLALAILLAALMTIQRTLSDDDLSYLAYLTNWQNSPSLNFNDVFFGADKLASIRFWLVSAPFSQAYLAEISGLPGIFVVGGYYEPFLAALSTCAVYELAQTLGMSRRKATLAALFQAMFLSLLSEYLHPGAPFLRQLSADKATAAYLFTPVFLQSAIGYLKKPAKNNLILILLTGLSLMLMHPVSLAFTVVVAGLVAILGLNQANVRVRFVFLILLALIMSPQIAIRFVNHEAQGVIPYATEEVLASGGVGSLIAVWRDTNFYGFNPSILAMSFPYAERLPIPPVILQYGWLLLPLLGAVLAIKNIRRDPLSQYTLACFLLGALAGIPFTGWLLGSLVSAWMLERTLWIYPFGIGTVFLLTALGAATGFTNRIVQRLQPLQTKTGVAPHHWLLSTLTIFSALLILLVMRAQNLPNLTRLNSNAERYRQFTAIANFMDARIQGQAFAAGTDELNNYIPAISSKAKVISYRPSDPSYPYFYSSQERNQKRLDRQSFFSREVAFEDRIALIRQYEIRFLWLKDGEYYMVRSLLSAFPSLFTKREIGGYYVIEVH